MDSADFTADAPDELVRNVDGHFSFVPLPLPGRLVWTDRLVRAVSAADQALGRLAGLGTKMPNPHRLVRMFLRREAELSSRIERTYARVQTIVLAEHLPEVAAAAPDVREVENNYRILQFACESDSPVPVTVALIRRMHEMLFDGVDAAGHVRPGEFRQIPNFIGHTAAIEEARYVPPPPQAVPDCMAQLVEYVRRRPEQPTVVRCAMAHYQFEAIHPFIDGNGRVGRALVLLMLNRDGVLPVPLLNPSAQLERRRRDYYDLLLDVTRRGAWADWVEFFAACVEREAADACNRLVQLDALRDRYRAAVAGDRRSGTLGRIVDELFADPAVTAPGVAARLNIDGATAQRLVAKLERADIVREVTGQRRNRVYLAQQIVDVFSDPKQA